MPSSDPPPLDPGVDAVDAASAVARYIAVAPRLPEASFPDASVRRAHLGELVDEIDCFVLDGFGVLNVGASAVPGAAERVAELRAGGRGVRVLTNGASFPTTVTLEKYARWGIEFADDEVVSSRDALAEALAEEGDRRWGFAALEASGIERLAPDAVLLRDDPAVYRDVDGFVLLGTGAWTGHRQRLLHDALVERRRPVLVGNPDLVAPHEAGLSREPGLFAHALADAGVCTPRFHGKPFGNAFELVRRTLDGIDPRRVAMVGDTLHTDILGGAAAGWRTVLVLDHGLMRTLDAEAAIRESGIRPDFIVPTT